MAASKPFRENWQTPIPILRPIVDWMNQIGHVLNNISMSSGAPSKVKATTDGIKFVLPRGGADGISDMGGSWGFKILPLVAHDGERNPYLHPEDESDGDDSSPRALPVPFANLIRDGGEEEDEEEPAEFWVKVLGGPAQVLGGREHVFPDYIFEDPLKDGTHIYIRYRITDEDGLAVCKWEEDFLTWNPDEDPEDENPFDTEDEEEEGRSMVFEIGAVGAKYENWVRQDRVGSITAVATINSSGVFVNPDCEEL